MIHSDPGTIAAASSDVVTTRPIVYEPSPPALVIFDGRNGGTGEIDNATSAIVIAGCGSNLRHNHATNTGMATYMETIVQPKRARWRAKYVTSRTVAVRPTPKTSSAMLTLTATRIIGEVISAG